MFTLVSKALDLIPKPYRFWAEVILVIILCIVGYYVVGEIQSCSYHKAQQEATEKDKKLEAQQDILRKSAEEKESKVKELEIQVAVTKQVAEQGKKVDEQLSQKIEDVAKEAANVQSQVDVPVDCPTRAAAVCNKYRAAGIGLDCTVFVARECHNDH